MDGLQSEWQVLQCNSERYEMGALALKLAAVAVAVIGLAGIVPTVAATSLLAVLWLQEGVFRTSQARLVARLGRIEACMEEGRSEEAYRLHRDWLATRPGTVGLVAEYVGHALRPTVAYPYVVLVAFVAGWGWNGR